MKLRIFILFTSLIFISAKCRKGPDIVVNPCKDKTLFNADFVMEEKVGDTSYITDKALAPGYVYFKAVGMYDSVRWFIGGSQNTSTSRNHVLYFERAEGNIDVRMIGYKKPNAQCFPNDKALDTLRKTLTIVTRDKTAGIVGRFLGYNTDNPSDTFSIYINADKSVGIPLYFAKNLPKNCPGATSGSDAPPRYIGLSINAGYAAFRIDAASTVCETVNGFGYLRHNDSLIINYVATPMSIGPPYTYSLRSKFTFVGVRKL